MKVMQKSIEIPPTVLGVFHPHPRADRKKTTKSSSSLQCSWTKKMSSKENSDIFKRLQAPQRYSVHTRFCGSNDQDTGADEEGASSTKIVNSPGHESMVERPELTFSVSHLNKSVLCYTTEELLGRQGLRGSERCLLDLEKFCSEFPRERVLSFLSPFELKLWDENPHMRQVFANRNTCESRVKVMHREMVPEDRTINPGTPWAKYSRRKGEAKTVEHWGQRKLLLAEIEFLTEVSKPGDLVLYAGAAPGTHINYLSESLFPELRWVLVDPAPFEAVQTDKITIINDYFTDELADAYRGRAALFISDIRALTDESDSALVESQVRADMDAQRSWTERVRARWSMLKFRLPYSPGATPYFSGVCHFQVWSGRTSTETRLWVAAADADPKAEKHFYDHESYSDICFYHNTVARTAHFDHMSVRVPGMDHCYDCTAELFILERYLRKRGTVTNATTKEVLAEVLGNLSNEISVSISTSRRKGFFVFRN